VITDEMRRLVSEVRLGFAARWRARPLVRGAGLRLSATHSTGSRRTRSTSSGSSRLIVCGYGGNEVIEPLRAWGFELEFEREWRSLRSGKPIQVVAVGVPG